ncbi:MAG: hypothetical protein GY711_20330 [bacterium]|nr:hypothetical protein [bacterium]
MHVFLTFALASAFSGLGSHQSGGAWVRLVDARTGAPIDGARVEVFEAGVRSVRVGTGRPSPASRAVSDSEGYVSTRTDGIDSGVGDWARIVAEGYGEARFATALGGPLPAAAPTVELPRAAALVVEVVDSAGDPVADVGVQLDASGYFLMRRRYTMAFSHSYRRSARTDESGSSCCGMARGSSCAR